MSNQFSYNPYDFSREYNVEKLFGISNIDSLPPKVFSSIREEDVPEYVLEEALDVYIGSLYNQEGKVEMDFLDGITEDMYSALEEAKESFNEDFDEEDTLDMHQTFVELSKQYANLGFQMFLRDQLEHDVDLDYDFQFDFLDDLSPAFPSDVLTPRRGKLWKYLDDELKQSLEMHYSLLLEDMERALDAAATETEDYIIAELA